jgi:two-component system OmpR family sensor kinase
MESLAGALLVGGPLALLLAGAVAYAIAASALRPVEDMRSRAATIGRADAAARLPVPAVEDELRRLSLTLNEMLGRIGRAAEHERRFIANASHELRTPLAALQAELELAERHAASAAELRDAIGRGRRDVARLIDLSNGLLDLAAVDEGRPATTEAVDVDELLRDVAGQRRHRAAAQGRELLVRPSGLTVAADAPAVRRALGNLVDNALVHGAGEVSVGADSGAGGGCIELWVHDEGALGAGVRPEQAFERFARGPDARNRPGAGLGLALVRGVAQAHGGSAELVDEPAGGVRAVLRLPADRS